jgi:Mannose-6-phosphate isomerase
MNCGARDPGHHSAGGADWPPSSREADLRLGYAAALALMSGVWLAGTALAAPVDLYTPADLGKIKDGLKAKAGSGNASDILARYPGHYTMLAYRKADGKAEIHAANADVFVIVSGKAKLITEGSVPDAKEEAPGELRGSTITGGKTVEVTAGDIVHIPAKTPHQMLIAPGDEVVYFVVKISETP